MKGIFEHNVMIEEKIDGSQFSFGKFNGELRVRSKGRQFEIDAADNLFSAACDTVKRLADDLVDGWTYRGEVLCKPKHNALAYDRVPNGNVIVFDIATGPDDYLDYWTKAKAAEALGLEVVPLLGGGKINSAEELLEYLDRTSCLGGQKIEGVVIKTEGVFGVDGKPMQAKYVSEAFKEVHAADWKASSGKSKIDCLMEAYRTPARWGKAVQHLQERGEITGDVKDIGKLLKEANLDIIQECEAEIKDKLWEIYRKDFLRACTRGLPEWYKQKLLEGAI